MPLWGNVDNAANSAIHAAAQENLKISVANRTKLFGNVTANAIVQGQTVGQFGVDVNEQQAAQQGPHGAHAGWNLRTVGQGGRAGRVFYETLVAMGSMSGDASDDAVLPNFGVIFRSQPQSKSVANNTATTFSVDAYGAPQGTTLTYQWQRNGANIADAGIYSGSQTPTLAISNVATLTANSFGVVVYAGSVGVPSANAVITVV